MNDQPNNKPKEPAQWDWVTERSSCTYPKIFKELMLEIENDVKTRNSLRPANAPYEFSIREDGDEFTVELHAGEVHKSVVFSLTEHSIKVRDEVKNSLFDVTLSFSNEGKCRLNVNDEIREMWQVRRMALEGLFFPSY